MPISKSNLSSSLSNSNSTRNDEKGRENHCRLQADMFLNPDGLWPINNIAPLVSSYPLFFRSFDDTVNEGIGFHVHLPKGTISITLEITHGVSIVPLETRFVKLSLYTRMGIDNIDEKWSTEISLDKILISCKEYQEYKYHIAIREMSLESLHLKANNYYTFQIARNAVFDDLVGDLELISLGICKKFT